MNLTLALQRVSVCLLVHDVVAKMRNVPNKLIMSIHSFVRRYEQSLHFSLRQFYLTLPANTHTFLWARTVPSKLDWSRRRIGLVVLPLLHWLKTERNPNYKFQRRNFKPHLQKLRFIERRGVEAIWYVYCARPVLIEVLWQGVEDWIFDLEVCIGASFLKQ